MRTHSAYKKGSWNPSLEEWTIATVGSHYLQICDLDAEKVENYAKSSQGRAETMKELQEAAEEFGRELLIDPEIAQENKPEEKVEDVILEDLPWEKPLKQTPPPESAVMSEPAPQRSSAEGRSSSSLRMMIQERLEKVQRQDIEMYHLDEVVSEENFFALEELSRLQRRDRNSR